MSYVLKQMITELPDDIWRSIKSWLLLPDLYILSTIHQNAVESCEWSSAISYFIDDIFFDMVVQHKKDDNDHAILKALLLFISVNPKLCKSMSCVRFIITAYDGIQLGSSIRDCTGVDLFGHDKIPLSWERSGFMIRAWRRQFGF